MPIDSLKLVAHADWSATSTKRWLAIARRFQGGEWRAFPPQPVGEPGLLLTTLKASLSADGCALAGFDFPIGLPLAYARRAGIKDFLSLLPALGSGEWAMFYQAAAQEKEISLKRPFYPNRPNGSRRQHLVNALGVSCMDELLRQCELPQPHRKAACPLFWTLGAQQVGKAAIDGWKNVLAPGLQDLAIWPFSGTLDQLLRAGGIIVVETYPAEFYHRLGIGGGRWSKRRAGDRRASASALLAWAARCHVRLEAGLQDEMLNGFGENATSEDRFDAVVGLFGMLDTIQKGVDEPLSPDIRTIEGWIFGQAWKQDRTKQP